MNVDSEHRLRSWALLSVPRVQVKALSTCALYPLSFQADLKRTLHVLRKGCPSTPTRILTAGSSTYCTSLIRNPHPPPPPPPPPPCPHPRALPTKSSRSHKRWQLRHISSRVRRDWFQPPTPIGVSDFASEGNEGTGTLEVRTVRNLSALNHDFAQANRSPTGRCQ